MGLRFRKSVKNGPFRTTFSKSGVSTSVGSKNFRVTKTASGKIRTTTRIPGTGISYSTQLGGSKLSGKSSPSVLWWLFISWWIWIIYLAYWLIKQLIRIGKSVVNKNKPVPVNDEEILPDTKPLSFEAVGLEYRLENLLSVAKRTKAYDLPDEEFISKYPNGQRIFKYYFHSRDGGLEPEPTNRHDPNAIKVMYAGAHIAYVPAASCLEVANLLAQGYMPDVMIRGGAFKYVENGIVCEDSRPYTVTVKLQTLSSK